jgi:hypothetical protein
MPSPAASSSSSRPGSAATIFSRPISPEASVYRLETKVVPELRAGKPWPFAVGRERDFLDDVELESILRQSREGVGRTPRGRGFRCAAATGAR